MFWWPAKSTHLCQFTDFFPYLFTGEHFYSIITYLEVINLSSDFCRQSRAISNVWWWTNLTMAIESAEISDSVDKFWLLRMKLRRRSSICLVALGNRSLYRVFIITISLSITGERIGLLQSHKKKHCVSMYVSNNLYNFGSKSFEKKICTIFTPWILYNLWGYIF